MEKDHARIRWVKTSHLSDECWWPALVYLSLEELLQNVSEDTLILADVLCECANWDYQGPLAYLLGSNIGGMSRVIRVPEQWEGDNSRVQHFYHNFCTFQKQSFVGVGNAINDALSRLKRDTTTNCTNQAKDTYGTPPDVSRRISPSTSHTVEISSIETSKAEEEIVVDKEDKYCTKKVTKSKTKRLQSKKSTETQLKKRTQVEKQPSRKLARLNSSLPSSTISEETVRNKRTRTEQQPTRKPTPPDSGMLYGIQPEDKWNDIWIKLTAKKWTYKHGTGLSSFFYVEPDTKRIFRSEDEVENFVKGYDDKPKNETEDCNPRRTRRVSKNEIGDLNARKSKETGQGAKRNIFTKKDYEVKRIELPYGIQPEDEWGDIWNKLKESGWIYKRGSKPLVSYVYVEPGTKREFNSENEVEYFLKGNEDIPENKDRGSRKARPGRPRGSKKVTKRQMFTDKNGNKNIPKNKIKDRSSTKTRKDENGTKQQMRSGKKTKILDTKSKKGTKRNINDDVSKLKKKRTPQSLVRDLETAFEEEDSISTVHASDASDGDIAERVTYEGEVLKSQEVIAVYNYVFKFRYKFEKYFMPGVEPVNDTKSLTIGKDFFTSGAKLREHLCAFGLPLKKDAKDVRDLFIGHVRQFDFSKFERYMLLTFVPLENPYIVPKYERLTNMEALKMLEKLGSARHGSKFEISSSLCKISEGKKRSYAFETLKDVRVFLCRFGMSTGKVQREFTMFDHMRLALWAADEGCVKYNRESSVITTPIIRNCDESHISELSTPIIERNETPGEITRKDVVIHESSKQPSEKERIPSKTVTIEASEPGKGSRNEDVSKSKKEENTCSSVVKNLGTTFDQVSSTSSGACFSCPTQVTNVEKAHASPKCNESNVSDISTSVIERASSSDESIVEDVNVTRKNLKATEKESASAKTDNSKAFVPVIKTFDKLKLSLNKLHPSNEDLAYGKKFQFEENVIEDFNDRPYYNECRIAQFLKNVMVRLLSGINIQPKFLFVAGGVGTGKSTTVQRCCMDASIYFQRTTKKRMHTMGLNGTNVRGSFIETISQIASVLGSSSTVSAVEKRLMKNQALFCLLLDEFDNLPKSESNTELLKVLFRWSSIPQCSFVFIVISNSIGHKKLKQFTPPSYNISNQQVIFGSLRKEDIEGVIKVRTDEGVFNGAALKYLAMKVANEGGDCRRALSLASVAVSKCIESLSKEELNQDFEPKTAPVKHCHVRDAIKEGENCGFLEIIDNLSPTAKIALCVAMSIKIARGNDEYISRSTMKGYLVKAYRHHDCGQVSDRVILEMMEILCDSGLLLMGKNNEDHESLSDAKYCLRVQQEDIECALAKPIFQESFYQELIQNIKNGIANEVRSYAPYSSS